jgi:hypothetical protein
VNEDAAGGGQPRNYGVPPESYGPPPSYFGPLPPPGPYPPPADAHLRGNRPYAGPPAMGMGVPPGYRGGLPPGKPPRPRRWWLLGGLGAFVVVAVVAAFVIFRFVANPTNREATSNTTAPSASSMPPVPMSALDGMLTSPADVAAAIAAPSLVSFAKPPDSHGFYSEDIADNNCVGVVIPAIQSFYDGTGWVSMRRQELGDTQDSAAKYTVNEAVVAYQDAGAAAKFYQRATERFHQCANRTLNVRDVNVPNSGAAYEMTGQVSEKDGIVSVSLLWEGADGKNCQHGVSVRNNVVIDVSDCGYNVPDSVIPALIKPIAAKVDTAR